MHKQAGRSPVTVTAPELWLSVYSTTVHNVEPLTFEVVDIRGNEFGHHRAFGCFWRLTQQISRPNDVDDPW